MPTDVEVPGVNVLFVAQELDKTRRRFNNSIAH